MLQTFSLSFAQGDNVAFQVPKGMLQTPFMSRRKPCAKVVSSPQGNATNLTWDKEPGGDAVSFKSPRECYKQTIRIEICIWRRWFQVPKGMLQTVGNEGTVKQLASFQVPKGMLQTVILLLNTTPLQRFQVPKGMLQTRWKRFKDGGKHGFQVPKGMLQTTIW